MKSLKPLPRKGQTEVIHCYVSVTPPPFSSVKMKHVFGLRVSQMFADSRGTALCVQRKSETVNEGKKASRFTRAVTFFWNQCSLGNTRYVAITKRKPQAFQSCIMNEPQRAEESQWETPIEENPSLLRVSSVLLVAQGLSEKEILFIVANISLIPLNRAKSTK